MSEQLACLRPGPGNRTSTNASLPLKPFSKQVTPPHSVAGLSAWNNCLLMTGDLHE